jgi:hypothetical protein
MNRSFPRSHFALAVAAVGSSATAPWRFPVEASIQNLAASITLPVRPILLWSCTFAALARPTLGTTIRRMILTRHTKIDPIA